MLSKPQKRSDFWDWEQSMEPFPFRLPPGFDTELLAADGMEPSWFIHPILAILCFSNGCQPPGVSSSPSEHPTCTTHLNPSAAETFAPTEARRETHSSQSHQSSLHSRSSHYTSGRHRSSTWGYCSGKPGIPAGCGASHLRGTHRTWMHRLTWGQHGDNMLTSEGAVSPSLLRCPGVNDTRDGKTVAGEGKGHCGWAGSRVSVPQGNWTRNEPCRQTA